ncbi:MAG: hypothetical protein WC178_02980 [Candidatus Paceibacterota bacterium]
MDKNIDFARKLVKGKIAETIFAQMLRETKDFTVLEFGYEKIIPELVQQGYTEKNIAIETLRTAPDFAVINKRTKEVKLIEVKYQRILSYEYTLKNANKMSQSWNPSYLFIATLDGFFFDKIDNIISNEGKISPLKHPQISDEMQAKYIKILTDFEQNN